MRVIDNNNVNDRLSCRTWDGVLRTVATNDNDKATLLNDYFCGMCTNDNGLLLHFDQVAPYGVNFNDIVFITDNVARVLHQIPVITVPSP